MTQVRRGSVILQAVQGDIAAQHDIDAVVNAANHRLMPGGGVAGALHSAAGPELARECAPLAPIAPGEAVLTGAHGLPNKAVIHCLGPVYGQDAPAAELLASCYRNAVQLAEEQALASVAFPALSTGVFGYPMEAAAEVAWQTLLELAPTLKHVRELRMVLFSEADAALHQRVLDALAHH